MVPHQNNTFQITLIGTIGWANYRLAKHGSNPLHILIDFTPEYNQLKQLNIITNNYKLIKLNCINRISYSQFRDSNSNESRRSILFDNEQKLALIAIWVHSDVTNYSDNTAYCTPFDSALNDGLCPAHGPCQRSTQRSALQ